MFNLKLGGNLSSPEKTPPSRRHVQYSKERKLVQHLTYQEDSRKRLARLKSSGAVEINNQQSDDELLPPIFRTRAERQAHAQNYMTWLNRHSSTAEQTKLQNLKKEERNRLAKVKRYEGTGPSGNQLDEPRSSQEMAAELALVRHNQAAHHNLITCAKAEEWRQKKLMEEQRKRLATLKRYEGIGLLGAQLDEQKSAEEITEEMAEARELQAAIHLSLTSAKAQEAEEKKLMGVQKKRLAKLKRYEGIGLLGNQLDEPKSSEEVTEELALARQHQAAQNDSLTTRKAEEAEQKKWMEQQRKRMAKLKRHEGIGLLGNQVDEPKSSQEMTEELALARNKQATEHDLTTRTTSENSEQKKLMEEQRKRLDKLKKYEGIGLLGKQSIVPLSAEEMKEGLALARQQQAAHHDSITKAKTEELKQKELQEEESKSLAMLNMCEGTQLSGSQQDEANCQTEIKEALALAGHNQATEHDPLTNGNVELNAQEKLMVSEGEEDRRE